MAELRGGVGLEKLRALLKGQMQEKRNYALLTELAQCETAKERRVSNRLYPLMFIHFLDSIIFP